MFDIDPFTELFDKDEKYLNFIRKQECIICQGAFGKSEAHHVFVGGMGMKCSDHFTVPLCAAHHTQRPDSIHKIGKENFEKVNNRKLESDIIYFLSKYIKEGSKKNDWRTNKIQI